MTWRLGSGSVSSRLACAAIVGIAVTLGGTLAGCGQKGPLMLPAANPATVPAPAPAPGPAAPAGPAASAPRS